MKIEHLGLWVKDLELMRSFYLKYFDTSCGEKYVNPKTKFKAYFILFCDVKIRMYLMFCKNIIFYSVFMVYWAQGAFTPSGARALEFKGCVI